MAAVRVMGWIDVGIEAQVLLVLDAIGRIAPFVAFFRTDTTTPTGEPSSEYVARHAVNSPDVVPSSVVVDTGEGDAPRSG